MCEQKYISRVVKNVNVKTQMQLCFPQPKVAMALDISQVMAVLIIFFLCSFVASNLRMAVILVVFESFTNGA
jgi:hypothetical protein